MATAAQNLSDFSFNGDPSSYRVGLIVSEWNYQITGNLLKGAKQALLDAGVKEENIHIDHVPGTYELALGSQMLLDSTELDGIVAIGSVVQGETKHFDFVCEAATQGIMRVGLDNKKPVIFCVLTDNTMQQAIDRSGGKHGNKGIECAIACLKMIQKKKG